MVTSWKRIVSDYLMLVQGGRCLYCGEPINEADVCDIDHKIGEAEGGADNIANLQLIHYVCHKLKHKTRSYKKPLTKDELKKPTFRNTYAKQLLTEAQRLYAECKGNKSEVARRLGISERMLRHYLKRNEVTLSIS